MGSSFDGFLAKEGLLDPATEAAEKRVFAWQLRKAMTDENVSEAELARRMGTSRTAVRRLLDPSNASATLQSVRSAARALGRHVTITLLPPKRTIRRRGARKTPSQSAAARR